MFMVSFTSNEGRPAYHTVETLDEAVRFLEQVRNNEGVTDGKLYQMTEVPIEVKAYYRVEVGLPGVSDAREESNREDALALDS